MNTLIEDLKEKDLINVERGWIRKPSAVILFLSFYPVMLLVEIVLEVVFSTCSWVDLFLECWNGNKNL